MQTGALDRVAGDDVGTSAGDPRRIAAVGAHDCPPSASAGDKGGADEAAGSGDEHVHRPPRYGACGGCDPIAGSPQRRVRPGRRRRGHRRAGDRPRAAAPRPGCPHRGARARGPRRRTPDRGELRRGARRHLLPARVAQGAAVRRRGRAALRLLRRARCRLRALRQGHRRRRRVRSWSAWTSSRRAAAPTACRGCGASACRSSASSSPTRGIAGLHSPDTGIVDFAAVARAPGRRRAPPAAWWRPAAAVTAIEPPDGRARRGPRPRDRRGRATWFLRRRLVGPAGGGRRRQPRSPHRAVPRRLPAAAARAPPPGARA